MNDEYILTIDGIDIEISSDKANELLKCKNLDWKQFMPLSYYWCFLNNTKISILKNLKFINPYENIKTNYV